MRKNSSEENVTPPQKNAQNAPDEGAARRFNGLICRIADGEQGAFEEFYGLFGRYIHMAAKSAVSLPELIDEAVDDVMVKIWNSAPRLPSIKNPFGWIYTVTVNCVKDRLKASKTYEDIFEISDYDAGIAAVESADSFASLLAPLDDDERQIVLLHISEDYSFKEIARMSGRPLSTVTSAYYRALAKIKGNMP